MNLYVGKDLNEALDKAADAENVDVEYLQYRILKENENEVEKVVACNLAYGRLLVYFNGL